VPPRARVALRPSPQLRVDHLPPDVAVSGLARYEDVVAASGGTASALRLVDAYARAATPVVFVGETGTGKSLLASLLHQLSGRSGPFVDVPAGELDAGLAADQLFGHVRGAYTGARDGRAGRLATARDGTILLDDFHLLRRSVQYLLLRAFERRVFQPVGSDTEVPLTCRLVVGVASEPDALVQRGRMLADLRHRLGHCTIRLPRLADRRDEILPLARKFLEYAPSVTQIANGPSRFDCMLEAVLETLDYKGNVRDLKGVVEAAYLHGAAAGVRTLTVEHLPEGVAGMGAFQRRGSRARQLAVVALALRRTRGRVGEAARMIGASRNTVAGLRKELGKASSGRD